VQEARDKAQTEADRIVEHAHAQIEADRKAAMASLSRRRQPGHHAGGRIVGDPWTTTSARAVWSSASSPTWRPADGPRGGSAEALTALTERLDSTTTSNQAAATWA
jgi:hypothetical protein